MGKCLGILVSGNYAISLNNKLRSLDMPTEIMATPCKLSKFGCSYCITFPEELLERIIQAGIENGTPIREVYRMVMNNGKKQYHKIYPAI